MANKQNTNTVNNGGSTPSDRGGGGGGNSDPEIREGPVSPKNFFRPFGPQFGLKIRAGGGGGACPPGPSPGSVTGEWFEPRSHFMSRLSLIVRVNAVLNRTVVDSD